MTKRLLIIAAAFLLILGGLVVGFGGWPRGTAETGGQALIGGPFSLVNQHGEQVTEQDFAGQFMLIYFGYTFCPDFCPMSLSTMTAALDALEPEEADRITPILITIDPARDTVPQLADYAPLFHPRLVALTGSDEAIAAAAKAYRVYYAKPPSEEENYPMDHSTFIYLMAPDGTYRTHFGHDATPEEMADRLKKELAGD
jgi:protein SCO1/2